MSTADGKGRPRIGLTRRAFFSQPIAHLRRALAPPEVDENVPGRMLLSELRELPESALMDMVPVLRPGWTARISQNNVIYRGDRGQEGVISLGPEGCAAVRLFDGTQTLRRVASEIETQFTVSPSHGGSIVREAFLLLAEREIYHPSGPLEFPVRPPTTEGKDA